MTIYINPNVKGIHYFGECSIIEFKDEEYILNPAKSLVMDMVLNNSGIEIEKWSLLDANIEYRDELRQAALFFIESELGQKLFTTTAPLTPSASILKITGKPQHYYPKKISIELTNKCNLYCSHCYKEANDGNVSSMNKDEIFAFLHKYKGLIPAIHLTGGEPLAAPYLEELIEEFKHYYHIELSSNGTLLHTLKKSTLASISNISLTLYGLSDEQYKLNTGNAKGFSMLQKSCLLLKEMNKSFKMNVVMNKQVLQGINSYIECAISLGANVLNIGAPLSVGRLTQSASVDDWKLTETQLNKVFRTIQKSQLHYTDQIKILPWERDIYYNASDYREEMQNIYSSPCLACGAGNRTWGLSETFNFTPCIIYKDLYNLNLTSWEEYIEGDLKIDWNEVTTSYRNNCQQNSTCNRMIIFQK
ncbi:radical SAM protein [Paenibacillus sp. FSL K6-1096]|uniref:radical SAM protein n=1 Tax=Paenibacillus sp. FSL K6-1096 TaxID=2921460 RepID=UPI0030ED736B